MNQSTWRYISLNGLLNKTSFLLKIILHKNLILPTQVSYSSAGKKTIFEWFQMHGQKLEAPVNLPPFPLLVSIKHLKLIQSQVIRSWFCHAFFVPEQQYCTAEGPPPPAPERLRRHDGWMQSVFQGWILEQENDTSGKTSEIHIKSGV